LYESAPSDHPLARAAAREGDPPVYRSLGNAPRLPAAEGDYRKRIRERTKAKEKAGLKSNPSVKRRDLIPGHEIYLMICQQIGGDPEAKKTITIDAGEERTAMKVRVNFYSWRQATIRELGPDFAKDNHLQDIKVYLDPVLDENGVIVRHPRRHIPKSNGKVIFYSIRSMREMQALSQALPQLGVAP
jgi:hypothetical protein